MIATEISSKTLDKIIALQFTIAWAGEALSDPPRLKWWRTDLVDEYGGGDLFERLAPRTHLWAGLEAAREAAKLVDKSSRSKMADPDGVRTLFFWGFEIDEQIAERVQQLKWSQQSPHDLLPFALSIRDEFDLEELERALKKEQEAAFAVQMSGRELKNTMPEDLSQAASQLAAALLPLADDYPAPFFRV